MNLFKRTIPTSESPNTHRLASNPDWLMGRNRTDKRLEYLYNLTVLYNQLKDFDHRSKLMERIDRTAEKIEEDLSISSKQLTIDGAVFNPAIRTQVNFTHQDAKIISNALQDRFELVTKSSRDGEEEYKERISGLINLFRNFSS